MKKHLWLVLVICMLFVASIAGAAQYTGGTGIYGTPHDLSKTGMGTVYGDAAEQAGLDRICIYCHAPHNTIKATEADGIAYIPLWNHEVTVQNYSMYSAGSEVPNEVDHQSQAAAELVGKTRPGSVSRLCLSCHDGTVSTNAYGFLTSSKGADTKNVQGTQFLIGGNSDLSNHHPIGFTYNNVSSHDNEIAKSSALMVNATTINDLLWAGKMECSTCHDVHNTKNAPDAEKFLWKSDRGSEFCMTCHLKKK